MMNALHIAPYWRKYFHHPVKAQLGLINAIFPVGKICGLAMVTPRGERFGRRTALLIGFTTCIIGSIVQAVSINVGTLVFSRWCLSMRKSE
jgi:MFS family permease